MRYTNTHKITTIQARQIRLKKIHVMKTKKVKGKNRNTTKTTDKEQIWGEKGGQTIRRNKKEKRKWSESKTAEKGIKNGMT